MDFLFFSRKLEIDGKEEDGKNTCTQELLKLFEFSKFLQINSAKNP